MVVMGYHNFSRDPKLTDMVFAKSISGWEGAFNEIGCPKFFLRAASLQVCNFFDIFLLAACALADLPFLPICVPGVWDNFLGVCQLFFGRQDKNSLSVDHNKDCSLPSNASSTLPRPAVPVIAEHRHVIHGRR